MNNRAKYDPGRWYDWLLPLASFTLPLHNRLNVIVLMIMLVVWLFLDGSPAVKWKRLIRHAPNREVLLAGVLYLLYVAGLTYSSNLAEGLFHLEIKLSLLLIPVVYATMSKECFSRQGVLSILYGFVAGSLCAVLICLGRALALFQQGEGFQVFYYSSLSYYHHPSYIAMYLVFSIVVLYFATWDAWLPSGKGRVILTVIMALFFTALVFMLSSKAGILSLLGALAYIVSYEWFYRKRGWRGVFILLAGLGVFALFFQLFPYSVHRIETAREAIRQGEASPEKESTAERIGIWKSAWEVISDHMLFGVGTGDVQSKLNEAYLSREMENAANQRLNAHNQYIQTFLAIGLPGFITLLLMMAVPLWLAFRKRDWIFLFFLLLFSVNMIFESMLEKQAGIVFYAFFNTMFLCLALRSDEQLT